MSYIIQGWRFSAAGPSVYGPAGLHHTLEQAVKFMLGHFNLDIGSVKVLEHPVALETLAEQACWLGVNLVVIYRGMTVVAQARLPDDVEWPSLDATSVVH